MNIPKHIAIIMDGNGRWAQKRLLPRVSGHKKGIKAVREVVKYCAQHQVEVLTLFAFSKENNKRSSDEKSILFDIFLKVLEQETEKLNENNIKLKIIGDLSVFPQKVQRIAIKAQQSLSNNTGMRLIIAANYSGQWDIVQASKKIATLSVDGEINPDDINSDNFAKYLSLAGEPSVDLLIRTSGELRISNFLLWEIAYSEFYFSDVLWPDFDTKEMHKAIVSFNSRERRFGARKG